MIATNNIKINICYVFKEEKSLPLADKIRMFLRWLKGAPDLKEITLQLEVFTRKLDHQRKRLENEARKCREKARKYRIEGNEEASRMYAEHFLRYRKWALGIDAFRLRIDGLLVKLRQAQSVSEVESALRGIRAAVMGLKEAIDVPDIAEMVEDIDKQMREIEIAQDITETGMERLAVSTEVTSDEINKVLAEIDQEIGVEAGIVLPEPSKKIKELEKDIKKLKEEL
ncbi:MAG: hypothetical protein B6U95_04555 [Thermofilum sp. ex4484_82]|nr:MAG: hypothetical protein B6U95_04555 [Thermofilum sp. ex4484_82]OYT38399.1 MAG: hypothetical protein B6U96_04550 [Archaeoglobales archaeon ex4484_92]